MLNDLVLLPNAPARDRQQCDDDQERAEAELEAAHGRHSTTAWAADHRPICTQIANGGSSWNSPTTLTAAPMLLSWLPNSQNGLMVGDYIATAFVNGVPHGVFAVAQATTMNPGATPSFRQAMYTGTGLTVSLSGRQLSSAHDKPLHKLSDRIEREVPEKGVIPPMRRRARRSAK